MSLYPHLITPASDQEVKRAPQLGNSVHLLSREPQLHIIQPIYVECLRAQPQLQYAQSQPQIQHENIPVGNEYYQLKETPIKPYSDLNLKMELPKKSRDHFYGYAVALAYILCVLYTVASIGPLSNIYIVLKRKIDDHMQINNRFLISNFGALIFPIGTVVSCFLFLVSYYRKKAAAMKRLSICFALLALFSPLYFWRYEVLLNGLAILAGEFLAFASYKLSKAFAKMGGSF